MKSSPSKEGRKKEEIKMGIYNIPSTDKRAGSEIQLCKILGVKRVNETLATAEVQYMEWNKETKKMFPITCTVSFWNDTRTGLMNADFIVKAAEDKSSEVLVQIGTKKDGSRHAVRVIGKNSLMKISYDDKEVNFIYGRIANVVAASRQTKEGEELQLVNFDIPVLRGGKKEVEHITFWGNTNGSESDKAAFARKKRLTQNGVIAVVTVGKEVEGKSFSGFSLYAVSTAKQEASAPADKAPANPPQPKPAVQNPPQIPVKDFAGSKEGDEKLVIGKVAQQLQKTIREMYEAYPEWVEHVAFQMVPWSDDPERLELMKSQQASCRAYLESIGVTGPVTFKA